jgi:hypothetical protein
MLGLRWRLSVCALTCILLPVIASPVLAAANGSTSPLRDEPLLRKKVSFDARRLYLGELLEQVSRETGVALEADDRLSPISGYELTVVVRERPARDLLEAVVRLYDAPPDRWYWSRVKRAGKTHYVLKNTLGPDALAQAREAWVRERLLQMLQERRSFYGLPPAERARLAAADPALMTANGPWNEAAFSLVAELPEQELLPLIAGRSVSLRVSELTPSQQQFARDYYRRSMAPAEMPETISLHRRGDFGIIFQIGDAGGGAALGGIRLQNELRQQAVRMWQGEGDPTRPPDDPVPAPGEAARPEELIYQRLTRDRILHRLARLGRLDLLFDHPSSEAARRYSSDITAPDKGLAGRLPAVLENLGSTGLIWRYREPFLLFRDAHWPNARRDFHVPWPVRRTLRASAQAGGGYLKPADWLLMAGLSQEQLDTLGTEFPDAGQVKSFQLPLRLAAAMDRKEQAALERPDGAGWADWSEGTRRRLLTLMTPAEAQRARMVLKWLDKEDPPALQLYLGSAAPPLRPVTLTFRPRKDPKEAEEERPTAPTRR